MHANARESVVPISPTVPNCSAEGEGTEEHGLLAGEARFPPNLVVRHGQPDNASSFRNVAALRLLPVIFDRQFRRSLP